MGAPVVLILFVWSLPVVCSWLLIMVAIRPSIFCAPGSALLRRIVFLGFEFTLLVFTLVCRVIFYLGSSAEGAPISGYV